MEPKEKKVDKPVVEPEVKPKKRGRPKQIIKTEIKIIPGPIWVHMK